MSHNLLVWKWAEELERPFVIEPYENCLVFNYGSEVRFDIVPVIGQIASGCGLNATEF